MLWTVLASIVGIVIAVIATMSVSGSESELKEDPAVPLTTFAVTLAMLYSTANVLLFGVTLLAAGSPNGEQPVTTTQALAHFGLEPGKEYPLQLGSRFAGSSGGVSVDKGLFSLKADGSWTPATSLSLGFTNESSKSWILELPVERITFRQVESDAAVPSVVIHTRDSVLNDDRFRWEAVPDGETCRLEIRWGWWMCGHTAPIQHKLVVSEEAQRAGLPPLINRAFRNGGATATITLSSAAYADLLNS